MIFCTLFNWSYVPQGVALYRSIERHLGADFVLYALCMDGVTARSVDSLNLPNVRIIHLHEIEDEAMLAVKPHRSIGEYCWTCTTPLLQFVQSLYPAGTVVTYVDADIAFFASPTAILDEMGEGSIYIHEHDFAPRYAGLEASSGRFNVGVSAFRNDEEGRACLALWRSQCIDECVMDFSAAKCGDQNYLDDWPTLYPNLIISKNPGIGLGPWNIEKYRIERNGSQITVDGRDAVFYHYHSLRLQKPKLGLRITWLSGWFEIPELAIEAFYKPYARELWEIFDITSAGISPVKYSFDSLPKQIADMPHHQLLVLAGQRFLPQSWSSRWLSFIGKISPRQAA
jgi:hypothetical protein